MSDTFGPDQNVIKLMVQVAELSSRIESLEGMLDGDRGVHDRILVLEENVLNSNWLDMTLSDFGRKPDDSVADEESDP